MKVLFCTKRLPELAEALSQTLTEHEVITCLPGEVAANLDGVDIVIPSGTGIDRATIENGHFGLIQQNGVGLEKVDIDAATRCGVWVARVPGAGSGNAESVGELAIWLMLSLCRKIDRAVRCMKAGDWGATPMGESLLGKTVCIVGLGD